MFARSPATFRSRTVKLVENPPAGIWAKSHWLNRMSLRELVAAYFQHHAIRVYLALAAVAVGVAIWSPPTLAGGLAAAGFAVGVFSLVWYVLHRFVLHGKWMWKSKLLSPTWKRIHYDHHQDPNSLEVLLGAPWTTLPTLMVFTIVPGFLIAGIGGAAIGFAAGLLATAFNEFCHCIQHLSYKPKNKWLADMKARHMAHHFHDETGNFGITDFSWDRLFGTFYERAARPTKGPSVFNLGYTDDVAARYPYVAELSGGIAKGHPRRRDDHRKAA